MNQINMLDKMNTNFVSLSDQELLEMEGGVLTLTTGALIGLGLAAAGLASGYYFGRK